MSYGLYFIFPERKYLNVTCRPYVPVPNTVDAIAFLEKRANVTEIVAFVPVFKRLKSKEMQLCRFVLRVNIFLL